MGDLNTLFSSLDRSRQKLNREIMKLTDIMNHEDLTYLQNISYKQKRVYFQYLMNASLKSKGQQILEHGNDTLHLRKPLGIKV